MKPDCASISMYVYGMRVRNVLYDHVVDSFWEHTFRYVVFILKQMI